MFEVVGSLVLLTMTVAYTIIHVGMMAVVTILRAIWRLVDK